jgi:hypothetical protein
VIHAVEDWTKSLSLQRHVSSVGEQLPKLAVAIHVAAQAVGRIRTAIDSRVHGYTYQEDHPDERRGWQRRR